MKIKNKETNEVIAVNNTFTADGKIIGRYVFGTRYYNKYTMLHQTGSHVANINGREIERPELVLDEPWVVVDEPKTRKERAPRKDNDAPAPVVIDAPKQHVDNVDQTAAAIAAALKGLQVQAAQGMDEATVRSMIVEEINKLPLPQPKQRLEVVSPAGTHVVDGVTHAKFKDICTLVNAGMNVFLYGDAGTGKSQLAEQVGQALGLDVYQIGAVKDVYQLRGSFTATGEYVPSTFYNAFTNGGLLIIDEGDAMDAEAALELNGALSQRRFDFPILGNMKAHENFRVIITGNTPGTGATEEYTGRSCLDAALLNRCFMVEIDYDRNIELACAGDGNSDLVDFVRDIRNAAKKAGIVLVVSYRNISQMATLNGLIDDRTLMTGAICKGMMRDEARIIYQNLSMPENRWAKMFKKVA